jgi:ribonuclease BN (tRNA processing enzyme)
MSDELASALPVEHALGSLLERHGRVLLAGAPGTGKTTLAARAAAALLERGQVCHCVGADPGLPSFGLPGAVSLAAWAGGHWQTMRSEALCTLDAARFRLPLVAAVERLLAAMPAGPLLVDSPGVVRGAGAAELLSALAEAVRVRVVVVLTPPGASPPLLDEFRALGLAVVSLRPEAGARRPGRLERERRRTAPWDAYLARADEHELDLQALAVIGTPPPRDVPAAWRGRQLGLLDPRGHTLSMGEALALEGTRLRVRAPHPRGLVHAVVVRDAYRTAEGFLATAPPQKAGSEAGGLPPEAIFHARDADEAAGPRPVVRTGVFTATLVNGVFGDPLLHVRLRHQPRSLLFDLGQTDRLMARIVHQVSDVFISHAHFDHIGGFLGLLRTRIGELPPCRLFGPPGLAAQVAGLVSGILWDRVGARAPRFEVAELHGDRLLRYRVIAGRGDPEASASAPAPDGVLLDEPSLRVRAVTLDHGTPVLAFAFEPDRQLGVRKERLAARRWTPGLWLGELKRRVLAGELECAITLPDGGTARADALAEELLLVRPGCRLVYATDLADTPANRDRLVAFASKAEILICEAPFVERESEQAARTGHLTTRACGEIAMAAAVDRLIPFHFSRRHAAEPEAVYAELRAVCPRVVVPPACME